MVLRAPVFLSIGAKSYGFANSLRQNAGLFNERSILKFRGLFTRQIPSDRSPAAFFMVYGGEG